MFFYTTVKTHIFSQFSIFNSQYKLNLKRKILQFSKIGSYMHIIAILRLNSVLNIEIIHLYSFYSFAILLTLIFFAIVLAFIDINTRYFWSMLSNLSSWSKLKFEDYYSTFLAYRVSEVFYSILLDPVFGFFFRVIKVVSFLFLA